MVRLGFPQTVERRVNAAERAEHREVRLALVVRQDVHGHDPASSGTATFRSLFILDKIVGRFRRGVSVDRGITVDFVPSEPWRRATYLSRRHARSAIYRATWATLNLLWPEVAADQSTAPHLDRVQVWAVPERPPKSTSALPLTARFPHLNRLACRLETLHDPRLRLLAHETLLQLPEQPLLIFARKLENDLGNTRKTRHASCLAKT